MFPNGFLRRASWVTHLGHLGYLAIYVGPLSAGLELPPAAPVAVGRYGQSVHRAYLRQPDPPTSV